MKKVNIKPNTKYPFQWMSQNYGHAEFAICPIWERGRMREIFIFPKQQDVEHYYHAKGDWDGIHLGTLLHDGKCEMPSMWKTYFCKEHKTMSMCLYVPRHSKSFDFQSSLGMFWIEWY